MVLDVADDDLVEGSNSGRTNLRFSEQKTKSETREGDNDARFFLKVVSRLTKRTLSTRRGRNCAEIVS